LLERFKRIATVWYNRPLLPNHEERFMAETPPPITSSPSPSQEEIDLLDPAAPWNQTAPLDAGNDSPATATEDSHKHQDQHSQPLPTASTNEAGNAPSQPPAAPASGSPVLAPVQVSLARGPDGRLYNPAKGEPPAKDTRPGGKAQTAAHLNQPKSSGDNELERSGSISGLDVIPKAWPDLPNNASLSSEVGWVQAERIRVVKEKPAGGVKVDLSKARSPAPSMAALSWLETSIRSYAKFVEVAARTASTGQDEQEFVRRERMRIQEIDDLLAEMYDAGTGK